MSAPNPIDDEELFASIELGGVKSPGKVTLSGHDRKATWDVKKGPGTNNPPAKPGGFEREPLKAAVMSAAHERHWEPPKGGRLPT